MKMAIPVWQDCVSGVLDFASALLIIEIIDSKAVNRTRLDLSKSSSLEKIACMKNSGIETIICDTVSRNFALMISSAGIELYPSVRGKIEDAIKNFVAGNLRTVYLDDQKTGRGNKFRRRKRRKFSKIKHL